MPFPATTRRPAGAGRSTSALTGGRLVATLRVPETVFGSLLPAPMGESDGQEYWVDSVNGSAGNAGTSIGAPKQTIGQVTALLGTTSSARIYLRNNADHAWTSGLLMPNTKFGISRDQPVTLETWPDDMNPTGLPGTRGEATVSGGELRFQPGDLKQNDYNSGNGFNFRLRNVIVDDIPGATTAGGQGTAVSGIRCDNVRGFEIDGVMVNAPSFCGALIRGAGRTTTLSGAIGTGDTSITVASAANFANAVPFHVVLGGGDGVEIVQVTSVGGGTNWTVVRGQLGTAAAAHNNGVGIEGYWQCADVQVKNFVVYEPSDGTDWAISHSHGIYWASDNGIDGSQPQSMIANAIFSRLNAARGGAYGINCYENGDNTIVTNVTSDGFRRGGATLSGEAVHATEDSLWTNNIFTNMQTTSPGPGYAVDSYMTGAFGGGSGNLVDRNLWDGTGTAANRTGADATGITFQNWTNDDPEYTNRAAADYTLQATSPAVGLGVPDYMLPQDVKGTTRTLSNYAAGAHAG